jgi:DNA-directed RNA polymerase subunit RPC12/RpoP
MKPSNSLRGLVIPLGITLLFSVIGVLGQPEAPLIGVVAGAAFGFAWWRSRCQSCGLFVLMRDGGAHLPPRRRYTRLFAKGVRCPRCGGEI